MQTTDCQIIYTACCTLPVFNLWFGLLYKNLLISSKFSNFTLPSIRSWIYLNPAVALPQTPRHFFSIDEKKRSKEKSSPNDASTRFCQSLKYRTKLVNLLVDISSD